MSSNGFSKGKLPYTFLGDTGVKVSVLGLGGGSLSVKGAGVWGMAAADEKLSHAILDKYVEMGGNFIDTADVYVESEECIGNWLSSKEASFRAKLIIASKVRLDFSGSTENPNNQGLSRKHIYDALEQSLKLLKTSYIDLYQVHLCDPVTSLEQTLSTLNTLVQSGKVRYIGVSNFNPSQVMEAYYICKQRGWDHFISLQAQYSLMCRSVEWELIPLSKRLQMGFLAWSPLAGGWLSGKLKRGMTGAPSDSRVQWSENAGLKFSDFSSKNNEHSWKILDAVHEIANELRVPVSQVALRWIMEKGGIPILGCRNLQQFQDNVGAAFIQLTKEQLQKLDDASAIPLPYPYDMTLVMAQRS